jgi:predicted amidohydrolase
LIDLLDGKRDVDEWLSSNAGGTMLDHVRVGCVPRNVQLVTMDDEARAGVVDVHAFLQAPIFWWLVSILWCISAGRRLDPLLSDRVKGYRLHPGFIDEPDQRGLMFRDHKAAYRAWKNWPRSVARTMPGQVIATNTIDLRDFYYSTTSPPREIVSRFLNSKGKRIRRQPAIPVLTRLLGALHNKYAERCRDIRPRAHLTDASLPLPVGLPSSRILANLVIDLALEDIASMANILGGAAYADDLLLMTLELPAMSESTAEYLFRLELIPSPSEPVLNTRRALAVADLKIGLDKSATSYSRSSERNDDEDEDEDEVPEALREDPNFDPYIESQPDPDWGGRLRTVLQAPHRRDRVPRELVRELEQMVDEIRIGVDPVEADSRLRDFVNEIDSGLFLALRPHWIDLLVVGTATGGIPFIKSINIHYARLTGELVPPPESSSGMRIALRTGLRASWVQALAQALSVAMGANELDELTEQVPTLFTNAAVGSLRSKDVVSYAKRLRSRRLIPGNLVSAPLAEFTNWDGPLIGAKAFASFMSWASDLDAAQRIAGVSAGLKQSVRFVHLHEVCIAMHLWLSHASNESWLSDVFGLLRQQPLLQLSQVDELADAAQSALSPTMRQEASIDQPTLRFALPSLVIDSRQLNALISGDTALADEIASAARKRVRSVVGISTQNKADILVLPEWSLPPQQLPWLMGRAADTKMLVVAGETPAVNAVLYSNRLWTGIPIQDSSGHRECLVPPPREKRFLSPEESRSIKEGGISHTPPSAEVPVYAWRGLHFASLICFEFADISARTALRSTADLITVSSLNKDWRYFDAIQESTTRDNYCLTLCVNSGAFPGTKLMRPTSSAMSVAASVHGSEDPAVVSRGIDVLPVLTARIEGRRPSPESDQPATDDVSLSDYSAYPPV